METLTKHSFITDEFDIQNLDSIKPYFEDLENRILISVTDLEAWMKDKSALEEKIFEGQGWLFINKQQAINNEEYKALFENYNVNVLPQIEPYAHRLNQKFIQCPFVNQLDKKEYFIYTRAAKNSVDIYNEANNKLRAEESLKSSEYGKISGSMFIEMEGKELTIQQAQAYLEYTDRAVRKEAFEKIFGRKLKDVDNLNVLYDELIQIRHQIAQNAGSDNFRDYAFKMLGRFDYTPEDCFQFHDSIKKVVLPFIDKIEKDRQLKLGYETLKPYDLSVDVSNQAPLKPHENANQLIDKTIAVLNKVEPGFGNYLKEMHEKGFLDLDSRKNKAPGGFLYPLPVSNVPFIFMNSAGTLRDLTTMVHEAGHAIHSYLSAHIPLNTLKEVPSEVAEYASMAMELLTMDYWEEFFENESDLKRAKATHLEKIILTLPWMALIDRFQHWVYTNPNHNHQQRADKWVEMQSNLSTNNVDYSGYENIAAIKWQSQLHLYEVPFYYIEYAMAQLGAIATYKQYRSDPKLAIENYKRFLTLGYTKPIGEIYKAAGIEFNFSEEYVGELINFVYDEYQKVK